MPNRNSKPKKISEKKSSSKYISKRQYRQVITITGKIIKGVSNQFVVYAENQYLNAVPLGNLKKQGRLLVGDNVEIDIIDEEKLKTYKNGQIQSKILNLCAHCAQKTKIYVHKFMKAL